MFFFACLAIRMTCAQLADFLFGGDPCRFSNMFRFNKIILIYSGDYRGKHGIAATHPQGVSGLAKQGGRGVHC